jgi:hypothetical protein
MKKNKICIICKSTFKYRSNKIYCSKNINNLTLPILFLTLLFNVCCAVLPVGYSKIKLANGIKLYPVSYKKIQNWQEDEHQLAIRAFLHSCNKFHFQHYLQIIFLFRLLDQL